MIKINLLTEVKQAQRKKGKAGGGGDGGFNINNAIIVGCLILGAGYSGFMYLNFNSKIKELDRQIAEAETEKARLQKFLDEVIKFEKKKASLQKKIELINDLKRSQKGPVRIMDEVSRMAPDLLWLDSMDMKNDALTINGRALNPNAIANFIDNIKGNPFFTEPNLRDLTQVGGPAFSFSLGFNYKSAEKKTAETGAAAGAANPGGAAAAPK